MNRATFGRKIGLGFTATVLLTCAIGAVAVYALRSVVESNDRLVRHESRALIEAAEARAEVDAKSAAARGFLLTGDDRFREEVQQARAAFTDRIERTRALVGTDAELDAVLRSESEHQAVLERVLPLRRSGAPIEDVARRFDDDVLPRRADLDRALGRFIATVQRRLDDAQRSSTDAAARAIALVFAIAAAALLLAIGIGVVLTRSLTRQVGAAVQHVQSSSAELQAAANQQATGSREQASAASEVSTTIKELLSTSRQIAESAQRVARISEDAASGARGGDATVQRTQDAIGGIKRQVDLVAAHMLDLGKKSQQIGGILEIINELADQTNILAINATIESAGAGEAGRRFSVIADEIRKLADRVAGSTREIRALVDQIRAAANTTVMATEDGAKAADAGTRQFADVTATFRQIADSVRMAAEAAREIELSTKQQATAVEQVNVAIANVAQAARENEVSTRQTLETSSRLASLSHDLAAIVRPQASA